MKKSVILLLAAVVAMLVGCKDRKSEELGTTYTIMWYGVGGGNLDYGMINNVVDALSEHENKKVRMTFELKVSKYIQDSLAGVYENFGGVRRWKSGDQIAFEPDNEEFMSHFPSNLVNEQVHDASYDMGTAEALAEFMQWSAKEYPADNYILVLSNHGNGWNIVWDADEPLTNKKINSRERAVLFDDNIDDRCLTIGECVAGVKRSGLHLKALYHDACLMGMAENIYPLMPYVDYYIGSLESVPGEGGAYSQFIKNLTQINDFEKAMEKYCDYCVSKQWWNRHDISEGSDATMADIAVYNLGKMEPAFDAVRDFSLLMTECLRDTTAYSVIGMDGVKSSYPEMINLETSRAEIALTSNSNQIPIVPIVSTSILKQEYSDEGIVFRLCDFIEALSNPEFVEILTRDPDVLLKQIDLILRYANYAVSIADYMQVVSDKAVTIGDNRFLEIRNRYMSALKSAAYIAATGDMGDRVYDYASMAVYVCSLSERGYHYFGDGAEFAFQGNRYAADYEREDLIHSYKASEFDQFAMWSEVLQQLWVNPSFLTNKTRYEVVHTMHKN